MSPAVAWPEAAGGAPPKYQARSWRGVVYDDVTHTAPRFPFYLRQVEAGPHKNFHYAVGGQGEAALVDPAFELDRWMAAVEADGHRVKDAFFTHGHWDHIGGIPRILEMGVERIYIHESARGHAKVEEALEAGAEVGLASDGDVVMVGGTPITWLHTPGHQPEASCLLAGAPGGPRALFGGDTLFVGSCGRTDFPGGDTDAMFASMARLRALEGDIHVMPGHHYAQHPHRPLAAELRDNPALATTDRQAFERLPFLRG